MALSAPCAGHTRTQSHAALVGWWCYTAWFGDYKCGSACACSECEEMNDINLVSAYVRSALLHKPRCPHFLHTSCNGLISACQVKNPCNIPLFLYLIQSCHYLLHFLHQLFPLFVPCLTSHQKVLHILHFSTVTFCTLPLVLLQTSCKWQHSIVLASLHNHANVQKHVTKEDQAKTTDQPAGQYKTNPNTNPNTKCILLHYIYVSMYLVL